MSLRLVVTATTGYALIGMLDRGLALLIMPITTRLFGPPDFAKLIAATNITALSSYFLVMLLMRALPAVLAGRQGERARQEAASTILWGTALVAAAVALPMWALAPTLAGALHQPESFVPVLRVALVAMVGFGLAYGLLHLVRSLEQHALGIAAQGTLFLVQTAVLLGLLLVAGWGIVAVFAAALVGYAAAVAIVLARLETRWVASGLHRDAAAEALATGLHMLALQAGPLLILNCSGLILNAFGRTEEAAFYSIASGAAGVLWLMAVSFEGVWTAYVLRRWREPDFAELARRVFELHSAACLLVAAAGALFAHEVFAVLMGARFVPAYALVAPLLGCFALLSVAQGFAQGLLLGERPWRHAWIGLLAAALYLALAALATGPFGVAGLLGSMAVAIGVLIVLSQRRSARTLPVAYPWARHLPLWALAALVVAIAAPLPLGWTTAAIKLAVLLGLLAMALVVLRLSPREMLAAAGALRRGA